MKDTKETVQTTEGFMQEMLGNEKEMSQSVKTRNEDLENMENRIWTIPNIMSFFRIALIPVIVWIYLGTEYPHWAGYVLILSGVTDVVDGIIARRFQMITKLGKALDPIADKLTQVSTLVCLVVRFPLMILPVVLMVLKESFMAITGMVLMKKKGLVFGADWHGKAATVTLYATMFLHVFWSEMPEIVSCVMIVVSSLLIGLSFVLYGARNLKLLKETC